MKRKGMFDLVSGEAGQVLVILLIAIVIFAVVISFMPVWKAIAQAIWGGIVGIATNLF